LVEAEGIFVMHIKRLRQAVWGCVVVLGLCVMLGTPLYASALVTTSQRVPQRSLAATSVDANVYLTNDMLLPMFQQSLAEELPVVLNSTITDIVSDMPAEDQEWASEMATALLQPSATLLSVQPQGQGLLATIKISLYEDDPKPQTVTALIGFSKADASTIQITGLPIDGKPGLLDGPLSTMKLTLGSLNSVNTTPQCGDSALKVGVKFPLATPSANTQAPQVQPVKPQQATTLLSANVPASSQAAPNITSYIEMPEAALKQAGSSVDSMPVSDTLTAKKIVLSVDGANLILTSDIYWGILLVGNAVSTVVPGAANGKLAMHVTKTDFKMLAGLISFPMNSYNQQIETMLNEQFNSALAGNFTVNQAAIGPNAALPCAARTSLVLGGELKI
jgi:hypothetical protein